jgi:hypothetical protein
MTLRQARNVTVCRATTKLADASAQTIRLKLLKLGALVRTSIRLIHFAIASGCPNKDEFALAHFYLQRAFSSA